MGAIELATGFVDLVPSARGFSSAITKQLGGPLDSAADKAAKSMSQKFTSALSGLGKKVGQGALAGAVALTAISVKNGEALQESQDQLANAIKNSGSSYSAQSKAIEAAQRSGEKLNFTYTQTNDGLTVLTRSTGSSSKALSLLGVTQDLARAKNIDLSTAALAVAKASEGQLKPLKALGIDLPVAAGGALKTAQANDKLTLAHEKLLITIDKIHKGLLKGNAAAAAYSKATDGVTAAQQNLAGAQNAGDAIITGLSAHLKGTAATAADSFKGKMENLKVKFEDVTAKIGLKLIPILEALATWLANHQPVIAAFAIVIGVTLVAAFLAWAASAIAATAATLAAVAPVLAVTAVVLAIAAAIIYAWTHWDQIWQWIWHHKAYAGLIAVVLPVVAVIFAVIGAAKYVFDNWATIWNGIENVVIDAANGIGGAINQIIRGENDLIQGLNDVNPFHDIPKIPTIGSIAHIAAPLTDSSLKGNTVGVKNRRARGGPVQPGETYWVGENGPEPFVPKTAGTIIPHDTAMSAKRGAFIGGDVNITARDTRGAVQELSWLWYTAS